MKRSELKEIIKSAMLAEVTSMEEAKEVNVEDNEDINIDVEDEVDVDDVSKKSEIEKTSAAAKGRCRSAANKIKNLSADFKRGHK